MMPAGPALGQITWLPIRCRGMWFRFWNFFADFWPLRLVATPIRLNFRQTP